MSDISSICPLCGKIMRVTIGTFYENDFCHCGSGDEIKTLKVGRRNWDAMVEERNAALAEIARLKAELEKAEGDRLFAIDMRDTSWRCYRNAQEERDEARKWARKMWARWMLAEGKLTKGKG